MRQSEAINDTHRLREAPSLEHLRLRRPQQLPRLLALIRSLGERGRERLLMPPDEGRNQGSSSAIKGHQAQSRVREIPISPRLLFRPSPRVVVSGAYLPN